MSGWQFGVCLTLVSPFQRFTANAIVHRVQLKPTSLANPTKGQPEEDVNMLVDGQDQEELSNQAGWDAAVKRHFGLDKMLASLESSSEAGLAKRVRFANSLNRGRRVLYFYGLGVASMSFAHSPQSFRTSLTLLLVLLRTPQCQPT